MPENKLKITLQNFEILLDEKTLEEIATAFHDYIERKKQPGITPHADKPNYRKTASKREIYIRFYGKTEWVRYPSKAAFRLMYPDIHFQCPTLEDEYKTVANEAETLFREFERTGNPIDAYRRWTSKRNPGGCYLATILNTARS